MQTKYQDYREWEHLDYLPVIQYHLPKDLLEFTKPGATVLDIGCGKGEHSNFLAMRFKDVVGVDINGGAIQCAKTQAAAIGQQDNTRYEVRDVLRQPFPRGTFDAIVLTRVLTCLPRINNWRKMLEVSFEMLRPSGVIFIKDFEVSSGYSERYQKIHNRNYNLVSENYQGKEFVAHHHTEDDLIELKQAYQQLRCLMGESSTSMNGNVVNMFTFIGQKRS